MEVLYLGNYFERTLNYVIINGTFEIFKYYVEELNMKLDHINLLYAIFMGKIEIVDYIFENGVELQNFDKNNFEINFEIIDFKNKNNEIDSLIISDNIIKIIDKYNEKINFNNFGYLLAEIMKMNLYVKYNIWNLKLKTHVYQKFILNLTVNNKVDVIYNIIYDMDIDFIRYLIENDKELNDCVKIIEQNEKKCVLKSILTKKKIYSHCTQKWDIDIFNLLVLLLENLDLKCPPDITKLIFSAKLNLNVVKYLFEKLNIRTSNNILNIYFENDGDDIEIVKYLVEELKCKYKINANLVGKIISMNNWNCKSTSGILNILKYFAVRGEILCDTLYNIPPQTRSFVKNGKNGVRFISNNINNLDYDILKYIHENSDFFQKFDKNICVNIEEIYFHGNKFDSNYHCTQNMLKRALFLEKICGLHTKFNNFYLYDGVGGNEIELMDLLYSKIKSNIRKYINNAKTREIKDSYLVNYLYNKYITDDNFKEKKFKYDFEKLCTSLNKKNTNKLLTNGVYVQFFTQNVQFKQDNCPEVFEKKNVLYNIIYPLTENKILILGDTQYKYFYSFNKKQKFSFQHKKLSGEKNIPNFEQYKINNCCDTCNKDNNSVGDDEVLYSHLNITDPTDIIKTISELQNINLNYVTCLGSKEFCIYDFTNSKFDGRYIGQYAICCCCPINLYSEFDSDSYIIKQYYSNSFPFAKCTDIPPYVFIPFDFSKKEIWSPFYDEFKHHFNLLNNNAK